PALGIIAAVVGARHLQVRREDTAQRRHPQPLRPQGERHRVLLRLPPERRAGRWRRGPPLPPRGADNLPAIAGHEVLVAASSSTRNELPLPSSLASSMRPPLASTAHRAMARPRPTPPCSRERPGSTR